jgi:hypothetical protein
MCSISLVELLSLHLSDIKVNFKKNQPYSAKKYQCVSRAVLRDSIPTHLKSGGYESVLTVRRLYSGVVVTYKRLFRDFAYVLCHK